MSLDPQPKQKPIKKLETSGLIILAQHPELVKKVAVKSMEQGASSNWIEGVEYHHRASQPVYTNPVQLHNDSKLFICKLYQQAGHVMEEERDALQIYKSLGLDGVNDKEQGTKEVVQELRRQQPPLIGKAGWNVFLTQEGLEYCERVCGEPWIRNRIN
jgi:hypothetical protein